MEISRDIYLNRLIEKKENGMIKVITGIRRCGKSYLLFNLFYRYLISSGVHPTKIIKIELDSDEGEEIIHNRNLSKVIKEQITSEEQYYLFLDEVQLYDGFEKVLNNLNRIFNLDIYVTGSNSKFLSSDILTEFRGRGDEVRVYPLSFLELSQVYDDIDVAWKDYYTYGGMPLVLSQKSDEAKMKYLMNLFKETYIKDIINRNGIRNDIILEELLNIIASSVGSLTNPFKLSNTFNSYGYKTNDKTITAYIDYLLDAFIISKAERYDIKGKKYISTPTKYFFSDVGLRNARLNFRQQEENHIMENIIYNELLIRGYNVDIGVVSLKESKDGKRVNTSLEVDFVCNLGHKRYYVQSAYAIPDQEKMNQEQKPLVSINDSFKKIIIVKEDIKLWKNDQGITIIGLKEFLLNINSLDL